MILRDVYMNLKIAPAAYWWWQAEQSSATFQQVARRDARAFAWWFADLLVNSAWVRYAVLAVIFVVAFGYLNARIDHIAAAWRRTTVAEKAGLALLIGGVVWAQSAGIIPTAGAPVTAGGRPP